MSLSSADTNHSFPALISGGWRDLAFERFRDGVEAHWLLRAGADEPSLAVLRYEPGASIPRHRHMGLETIVVLDGTQSDEHGDYPAGSLMLNPVGTEHSVWTATGCVVLIQWNRPVLILEEAT